MEEQYINILKTIEENNFTAFIVGGYVRDKLLGIKTKDIDIITNAKPKDLQKIFPNIKIIEKYGSSKLKINNQIIDITTYRKELSYKEGKPNKIIFIDDLKEDLKRRDFTINTLCMNKERKIINILNGKEDLEKKIIKTIREPNIEFKEDPSRIIRALRFMSELNLNLDKKINEYIINNKQDLKLITNTKLKEELDKLFKTKKVTKFINYIKENKLEEYIGITATNFKETSSYLGVWAQLEIRRQFPFNRKEKRQIKLLKDILKKETLDKIDIYKIGLYNSLIIGEILNKNIKEIKLIYTNLPIKCIIDIEIKSDEICKILNIKNKKNIGRVINYLEKEIIEERIKNNKEEIIAKLLEVSEKYD